MKFHNEHPTDTMIHFIMFQRENIASAVQYKVEPGKQKIIVPMNKGDHFGLVYLDLNGKTCLIYDGGNGIVSYTTCLFD